MAAKKKTPTISQIQSQLQKQEAALAAALKAEQDAAAKRAADAATEEAERKKIEAETQKIQREAEAIQRSSEARIAAIQKKQQAEIDARIAAETAAQERANAAAKAATEKAAKDAEIAAQRETVGKIVSDRFASYNLASLAPKILDLARKGYTEATITIELQNSEEYQKRFAGNIQRAKNNLSVLQPAAYLAVEDGYRQTLRAYGLTQFDTDAYVQKFIENDVSPEELSSRVTMAVQRVQNADPAISKTLRDYYGIGDIDLVAYVLDPSQQITKIQRQVAAAEVGTAARRQGLEAGVAVSEQLAAQGIDKATAEKGYATIADILPTAEKLSAIYGKTMDTYGQAEAEQEVFNSLASAQRKRRGLTEREIAQFSGASGTAKGSLAQDTGGQF